LGTIVKAVSIISASLVAIPLTYFILLASMKLVSGTGLDSAMNVLLLSLLMLSILTGLAIYSSNLYAKQVKDKDPSEVVIDEVLGQTLSMILTVPFTFPLIIFSNLYQSYQPSHLLIAIISLTVNIVLFRIFDSTKPWPVNAIEKLKGGFGIILDDIAAGFFAAVIYYAILLSIIN
jgi:phosphatidylglycerophosphatase A